MTRLWLLAGLAVVLALSPWTWLRAQEAGQAEASAKAQPNAAPKPKQEAETAAEGKFIRLRRDAEKQPVAMETAVVRYTAPARPGVVVDLIGAVHVGDKAYYEALNARFKKYDVVLYELVAPEGTRVPKGGTGGRSGHPVGALQNGMSSMLDLAHQLDEVDYSPENFLHADMSPAEFGQTMSQRGESFVQMFLRLMGQGMVQGAAGNGPNDVALLMALFSKDRATQLKIIMAEQFDNLEGQLAVLDGPEGSTIVTERNRKAFEVLDKQLAAGKRQIAVFYGAAHLPDMERRLTDDRGFRRTSEDWLVAWQLQPPSKASASDNKASAAPGEK